MSYFQQAIVACNAAQARLDDMWRLDLAPGADELMPVAEFLTSSFNKRGIVDMISPGRSKYRTGTLIYRPRQVEANIKEDQANPNCDATGYNGELTEDYTIDTSQNLQAQSAIAVDAFDNGCWPNADYYFRELAYIVDGLDRKVATQLTNEAALLSGDWSPMVTTGGVGDPFTVNTAAQTFQMPLFSGYTPNPLAWGYLDNALNDSALGGQVFMAGGGAMRIYSQATLAGCCTDTGIDIGKIMGAHGRVYAYDYRLKRALGTDTMSMVFKPGALQVVQWNRFTPQTEAPFAERAGNYFHTQIASSRLGVTYDLTLKDDCGALSMAVTWTGKVIGMPDDMFAVSDPYEGVTGVVKIVAI